MNFSRIVTLGLFPIITAAFTIGVAQAAPENRDRSFDSGWRFLRADAPGAEAPGFDDSTWRTLDVPHVSPSGSKPASRERFKTGHSEAMDSYHFWFFKQGIFAAS